MTKIAEVRSRVGRYDQHGLADALVLVRASLDAEDRRADVLERKATILVGYAGAIIGLVIPWVLPLVRTSDAAFACVRALGGASLVAAVVSSGCAFLAFRARGGWSRLQPTTLLPKVPSAASFELCRVRAFWVAGLYGLCEQHRSVVNRKATWIMWSQWGLGASLALLALAVGVGLYSAPAGSATDAPRSVALGLLDRLASAAPLP